MASSSCRLNGPREMVECFKERLKDCYSNAWQECRRTCGTRPTFKAVIQCLVDEIGKYTAAFSAAEQTLMSCVETLKVSCVWL